MRDVQVFKETRDNWYPSYKLDGDPCLVSVRFYNG